MANMKPVELYLGQLLFCNGNKISLVLVSMFVMTLVTTVRIFSIRHQHHLQPGSAVTSPRRKCVGSQHVPDVTVHSGEQEPIFLNGALTPGRYVSMTRGSLHGQRVGNQLFNLAAMLHVARLTGRHAVLIREKNWWIDRIFNLNNIPSLEDAARDRLCPCATFAESAALSYEHSWSRNLPTRSDLDNTTILLQGYTQSWMYTNGVERQLRRHLQPLNHIATQVCRYFDEIRPDRWTDDPEYVRVGIHIRAGDVKSAWGLGLGYTVPQLPYFESAIDYIVHNDMSGANRTTRERIPVNRRIQLIVASDEVEWCKLAINISSVIEKWKYSSPFVDIQLIYSVNKTEGFDLIMLSQCDAVVMTTGTYGWWAAWLADRPITIYYENWPRASSVLSSMFKRDEFFPPHWIPMGGPYFTF